MLVIGAEGGTDLLRIVTVFGGLSGMAGVVVSALALLAARRDHTEARRDTTLKADRDGTAQAFEMQGKLNDRLALENARLARRVDELEGELETLGDKFEASQTEVRALRAIAKGITVGLRQTGPTNYTREAT